MEGVWAPKQTECKPLPLTTPVENPIQLLIARQRESHRIGGFQGNPFAPYIVHVDPTAESATAHAESAAMVFLMYVSMLNTTSVYHEVKFNSVGVTGGTFSKMRFIGALESITEWLAITEEPIARLWYDPEYSDITVTFSVLQKTPST